MKIVDILKATNPLADYIEEVQSEPLVVTDHGVPTAVLLPLTNTDMETLALSTNPDFIALIERSRARARDEGGVSSEEMRRRVLELP
jgi:prevent-host-death family protein